MAMPLGQSSPRKISETEVLWQAYGQHMGLAAGGLGQDAFGYAANGLAGGNMMDALQASFAGLSTGGGRRESMGGSRHNNNDNAGQQGDS